MPEQEAPHQNLYDRLVTTAETHPDHPVFAVPERLAEVWQVDGGTWSYRTFLDRTNALKDGFATAGWASVDGSTSRVALLLGNQPDFYAHWMALNALGVSIVPINPDYQREEIRYLFEMSGARTGIVEPDRVDDVQEAAGLVDPDIQITGHRRSLPATDQGPAPEITSTCESEAALLFTSGTTSRPKACQLSNDYFLYWGIRYPALRGHISLRPGKERLLQPLPTFHINALANAFMAMMTIGGCMIPVDRFHPRSWWQDAAETGATCFHYLGVMPAMLMSLPPDLADRAHGMRFGMGGGIDPTQHAPFEERFGTVLCEGWAMTEGGATALMADAEEPRSVGQRCIGIPGPHQETRLVDEAGGVVEGAGRGELQLRHAGDNPKKGFFSGYLNDPEATAAAWEDGWFRTGDAIRRDEAGKLFFAERRKNIIRRSGENITPGEVESVLRRDPAVGNVAVTAIPDDIREEEVGAIVERRTGAASDEAVAERLFDLCRQELAYFKSPGWIVFVEKLPVTATQKIGVGALRALFDEADPAARFDFRRQKKRPKQGSS